MDKTVKQLANQVSVSKNTIMNRIKENSHLKNKHTYKKGNKVLIDLEGQKTILSNYHVSNREISENDQNANKQTKEIKHSKKPNLYTYNSAHDYANLINISKKREFNYQKSLQAFQNQLNQKNEQINDLSQQLKNQRKQTSEAHKITDHAQALQADLQRQLQQLKKPNQITTKKHWWQFWRK